MRYTGVENWAPVFENLNAYNPARVPVRARHRTPRAARGAFVQQQSADDVAGDATQQDRRNLQAGHVVRLSERDHARSWRPRPRATSASRVLRQVHGEWTSPVTSRCCSRPSACTSTSDGDSCIRKLPGARRPGVRAVAPQMISVTEQSTRPRLSSAGAEQQQHARAELDLPRRGGLRHRVAQLQDGIQPGARLSRRRPTTT